MARPTKKTVTKAKEKLQSLNGAKSIQDPWGQMDGDPDLEDIMEKGEEQSPEGMVEKLGKDGQCHWNTADLFKKGEIDEIVIGYAHTPSDGWHQHTWGRKDGKVVETTRGNLNATSYFGLPLKGKEAEEFAKWVEANPPGGGKVRLVKASSIATRVVSRFLESRVL